MDDTINVHAMDMKLFEESLLQIVKCPGERKYYNKKVSLVEVLWNTNNFM